MLPLTTTTISGRRPGGGDPMLPGGWSSLFTGVAAVVHSDSGGERRGGGSQEDVSARLDAPAGTPLDHYDQVLDEATGQWWEVQWVRTRRGFGLDHIEAGLRAVDGVAASG